jgi:hypothetical protein
MSRTDVHAPYWTWAAWFEPEHGPRCPYWPFGNWRGFATQPCNLPERPVRQRELRYQPGVHQCTWGPVYPPYRQLRWLQGKRRHPGRYTEHVGHNPERVRQRDKLGQMVKEYNATGELDDGDFPNWQARHSARWLWD